MESYITSEMSNYRNCRLLQLFILILFAAFSPTLASSSSQWITSRIFQLQNHFQSLRRPHEQESLTKLQESQNRTFIPLSKSSLIFRNITNADVKERKWVQPILNDDAKFSKGITTISNDSAVAFQSSLWFDRTVSRMVKLITYFAIGQSFINLLKANKSEITKELANKLFSEESVEVIKTIQTILSDVHTEHGVVDVFGKYRTMDVLSSIIAFSRLQASVIPYERFMALENFESVKDSLLLNELAHFATYAHAAYGWSLELALRWRIHAGGNNQALVRLTGIDKKDVIKAEWSARPPHRPAYYIVRDHRYQAIVLCVRGTWSAHDMLTNLCCTTSQVPFGSNVFDPNTLFNPLQFFNRRLLAHQGMVEAARAIKDETESIIADEMKDYPTFSLVLVGHSLGGGCAAILGKLFENQYPTRLKAYLFGAPCVARENTIPNRNIISVIAKGDPFSCLSLGHLADVSAGIAYLCEHNEIRNEILRRTANIYPQRAFCDVDETFTWCQSTMNSLRKKMNAEKLYPPGRTLLLRKGRKSSSSSRWWRWLRRRNNNKPSLQEVNTQYFQDLVVNAKMFDLSKHLPSMYLSTLADLIK